MALETISLLLSKDTPMQASLSLSQDLRNSVGMGTMGMDKVHAPFVTEEQQRDYKTVARGWKSQALNKSVDSILASASRLEEEIGLETRYWEEVLGVSNKGWAISRLPQANHILGVTFGFSEGMLFVSSLSLFTNYPSFTRVQESKPCDPKPKRRW